MACSDEQVPQLATGSAGDGSAVSPVLAAHTPEFERRVYRVTEGVHLAVGFGLANSILVEGDDCAFVFDVLASREKAEEVRAEFERITDKPIEALVYTHNHADHVFGGRGFVPEGPVDVYAHVTTSFYIDRLVSVLRPIIATRSERMFGNALPKSGPDRFVNAGIGPALELAHGEGTLTLIRPNRTFADRLSTEICGVEVEMVHAPGETADQIFVWLPERRVLMPGDNVYKAFPNLYTIRGTPYRDVLDWVRSLDAMRELEAEHLAPSHTRPVSGKEKVAEILTAYRDAIQYVHDQTVRGMNQGLTPDELVEEIELPPHLKSHPYLAELYGTVEWSVRSIFAGYLGWFGGDTATLSPAPPAERAAGYVALAGGREALLAAAVGALEEGRSEWAAELASHVLRLEPEDRKARQIKAAALRDLGQRSTSPNGRNYYITQALELEGAVEVKPPLPDESVIGIARTLPIRSFIAAMPANLDPEKSADVERVMGFRFPDVQEAYALHVRRGVAELIEGIPDDADVSLTMNSGVWIEVVLGARSFPVAVARGDIVMEGGALDVPSVLAFLALFQ
jgi:alkyl sulfatase BDS1-like metallo-beta-lactamase superfamily hydrolase